MRACNKKTTDQGTSKRIFGVLFDALMTLLHPRFHKHLLRFDYRNLPM